MNINVIQRIILSLTSFFIYLGFVHYETNPNTNTLLFFLMCSALLLIATKSNTKPSTSNPNTDIITPKPAIDELRQP